MREGYLYWGSVQVGLEKRRRVEHRVWNHPHCRRVANLEQFKGPNGHFYNIKTLILLWNCSKLATRMAASITYVVAIYSPKFCLSLHHIAVLKNTLKACLRTTMCNTLIHISPHPSLDRYLHQTGNRKQETISLGSKISVLQGENRKLLKYLIVESIKK